MNRNAPGNGSGKIDLVTEDMGGWIVVRPAKLGDWHNEELPSALRWGLQKYFRDHPNLRLLSVTALTHEGSVVELVAVYGTPLPPLPPPPLNR
jgi:hypothetical protein